MATFGVEGCSISAVAQPFRFYLLKRLQEEVAANSAETRLELGQMLASVNMQALLDMTLTREIGRVHNLEVWL
jgi:hypothetical protein|tara:strand:+ start:358 stop:576 length:219 start_codon:yes stop_codon:yes gene_type:complete